MTFYNKKEEVMDIQLTQYGRMALATGKFRPHYYAFFDDDVVYDLSYTGESELQSEIQDRILTSVRKKSATSIYGSETRILETNEFGAQKDGLQQLTPNQIDSELLLKNELLNASAIKDILPAIQIDLGPGIKFDITSGITKTTGSYNTTSYYNLKSEVGVRYLRDTFSRQNRVNDLALDTLAGIGNNMRDYPSAEGSFAITLKEGYDFCDEDEYEITLYEIENPNSNPRLKELYFESSDSQKSLVSRRFVVLTDSDVPHSHVSSRLIKDCESTSFSFIPNRDPSRGESVRDFYEKLNFEAPSCNDEEES